MLELLELHAIPKVCGIYSILESISLIGKLGLSVFLFIL